MPAHITMWSYLWDLVDDGIDDVLHEMQDEIGLTALSLATHYHSVEHLRPHTEGPFIYRADSSLYFPPDLSRYRNTKIRHQIAPLAQRGNPLARVCERAASIGLEVVSWTLACHSSHLGQTYPECSQLNALGDRYPEALCPANPDVRGFLVGLVDDLTHNYGISVAELESCHYEPARHYHRHEKLPFDLGAVDQFLLALCFCEHCVAAGEGAGMDVRQLRASVAGSIGETMRRGTPAQGTVQGLVQRTTGLGKFLEARVNVVNSLIADIVKASAATVSPITGLESDSSGLGVAEVIGITGSVTITAYSADKSTVRQSIGAAAKAAGGVERLRVGYHAFPPIMPDRESLLRVIAASLDEGVRSFSFYNYGIAPKPCLKWVRDAARLIHDRVG